MTEQQKQVRRVILRMMLNLHALVRSRRRPTEELLVNLAIRLGQYEGRPLGATEIAEIASLPRTSVLRHLKTLEDRGATYSVRVGRRRVRYLPVGGERLEVDAFYAEAEKVIHSACDELSILDTSPGASSAPRHGK